MSDKKLSSLTPLVRDMAVELIARAKKELGLDVVVVQTKRTRDEQIAYHAQGRDLLPVVNALRAKAGLKPITQKENNRTVTNARVSVHEFGCALDVAIMIGHELLWDTRLDKNKNLIPEYAELGLLAEKIGFTWGGRFGDNPMTPVIEGWDQGHLQYTGGLMISQLMAGARPAVRPGDEKAVLSF